MGQFDELRASLSPEELATPASRGELLKSMSVMLEEAKTLKARLDLAALDVKALTDRITRLEELNDHAKAKATK